MLSIPRTSVSPNARLKEPTGAVPSQPFESQIEVVFMVATSEAAYALGVQS